MSYADSLMAKDEQILYRARQHWLAPVSDSLRPLALVILGLAIFFLATLWKADGVAWQIMAGLGLRLNDGPAIVFNHANAADRRDLPAG